MVNSLPDQGYYLTSDNIPKYYTWIEVEGKPLQVYGIEEKENKIFGYIEAQEGKQFEIHCADLRTTAPKDPYLSDVYIDGALANGEIIRNAASTFSADSNDAARFSCVACKRSGDASQQRFLFSKLQLTDDDELACNDEHALKSLGTVKVSYHRVKDVCTGERLPPLVAQAAHTFHEKAKKAKLSHQASYLEETTSKKWELTDFNWVDQVDSPLQTYEFRYRSRQLLQLEGFIPDSPEPSPESSPSPVPQVVASPSPAQAPASPLASTSNTRPVERINGPSSGVEADERQRIARLEAELESLRRQERIATLERELLALRSGSSTAANGGASSSHKIKADPDERTDIKRVKREAGEASSSSQASSSGKGKGKAKEKPAVIELSDSE